MAYQWRAYTAAGHSHWTPAAAAAVVLVRVMQLSSCALNTTRHSILLDIYQLNTSSIFLSFMKCFSIVTAVVMSSQTLFTVTQETLHKLRLQSVRVICSQPTTTLQSTSQPLLHIPRTRTVYGSRAFSVAMPTPVSYTHLTLPTILRV